MKGVKKFLGKVLKKAAEMNIPVNALQSNPPLTSPTHEQELREEINRLQDQLEMFKQENKELLEIAQSNKDIGRHEAATLFEEKVLQLEKINHNSRSQIEDLLHSEDSLKEEVNKLKETIRLKTLENDNESLHLKTLLLEKDKIVMDLEEKETELENVKNELRSVAIERDILNRQLKEANEVNSIQFSASNEQQKKAMIEASMIDALRQQRNDISQQLQNAEDKIVHYKRLYDSIHCELQSLSALKGKYVLLLSDCETRLKGEQEMNELFRGTIADQTREVAEAMRKINQLESEASSVKIKSVVDVGTSTVVMTQREVEVQTVDTADSVDSVDTVEPSDDAVVVTGSDADDDGDGGDGNDDAIEALQQRVEVLERQVDDYELSCQDYENEIVRLRQMAEFFKMQLQEQRSEHHLVQENKENYSPSITSFAKLQQRFDELCLASEEAKEAREVQQEDLSRAYHTIELLEKQIEILQESVHHSDKVNLHVIFVLKKKLCKSLFIPPLFSFL